MLKQKEKKRTSSHSDHIFLIIQGIGRITRKPNEILQNFTKHLPLDDKMRLVQDKVTLSSVSCVVHHRPMLGSWSHWTGSLGRRFHRLGPTNMSHWAEPTHPQGSLDSPQIASVFSMLLVPENFHPLLLLHMISMTSHKDQFCLQFIDCFKMRKWKNFLKTPLQT